MKLYALMLTILVLCITATVGTTRAAVDITPVSFHQYKTTIWNQYHWTNRALRNRCRQTFEIAEFTKYPLSDVRLQWRDEHIRYAKKKHHRAQNKSSLCIPTTVSGAIEYVFGQYATEAHKVASCESGHSIWAVNGQYVGVFQMGYTERKTYGWYEAGAAPYTQVKSAWNYFVASGRDWSPWDCQP